MHVQSKHMTSYSLVNSILSDITHNENWVKSRKDRCLEVNLFGCVLEIIVSSEKWIGCCKYWASRIQNSGDSCLRDWNSLLLHGLMNGHSVLRSHLIKLVNADNSTVSQYHCTTFKLKVSTGWIPEYRCCQTSCWWSFTTCVNGYWCDSVDELQELRLSYWRITK